MSENETHLQKTIREKSPDGMSPQDAQDYLNGLESLARIADTPENKDHSVHSTLSHLLSIGTTLSVDDCQWWLDYVEELRPIIKEWKLNPQVYPGIFPKGPLSKINFYRDIYKVGQPVLLKGASNINIVRSGLIPVAGKVLTITEAYPETGMYLADSNGQTVSGQWSFNEKHIDMVVPNG